MRLARTFRPAVVVLLAWTLGWVALTATADASDAAWRPTTWQGESAYESSAGGWRAIVSVERARLVHLGPAETGANLLFAPATRDDPQGWGGHRTWLGPQSTWSGGWPPPRAWEAHGALRAVNHADGRLELILPSAGDGWPTFHRDYAWDQGRLVCGIEVQADGTRAAQVVQILQVPATARVRAQVRPTAGNVAGYLALPSSVRRGYAILDTLPPHAERHGDHLRLRHLGQVEKLGFRPHPLWAEVDGVGLRVARGVEQGDTQETPDEGFVTQVYLGGREPFIELEQLSPRWAAGTHGRFEMVIEPGAAP